MKVVFPLAWLILSVVVFLLFIIIAIKKRNNRKTFTTILLLGIVLTNIIILSSLFYYGNTYDSSGINVSEKNAGKPFILVHGSEYEISNKSKIFYSILYGVMNAPKMGTFGLKYPIIYAAAFDFPNDLGKPYGVFIVILSIFTPFIFGGFLVSYIKTLRNFFSYNFNKQFRNVYFFSNLNQKSILLAKDIVEHEKNKALVVFCNCSKVPSDFEEIITKKHFIVLSDNEHDLILRLNHGSKKRYYFEISDDDNKNLEATNKLINKLFEKYDKSIKQLNDVPKADESKTAINKMIASKKRKEKKNPFENLRVYCFVNTAMFGSEELFILNENNKAKKIKLNKIQIILVDKIKTSVNNLLFKKPLCYEIKKGKDPLSIAVFGDGVYAKEFFKNSIWASVLDDSHKTKISFIDENSDSFENNLKLNCPELFTQYYKPIAKKTDDKGVLQKKFLPKLIFCPIDLCSPELEKYLQRNLKQPNYIVIDTGNDEANIRLAIFLRMFYLRNSEDFHFTPFIAVKIQDSKTAKRVSNMKVNDKMSYELYPFGTDIEIYSYNFVVESPIERLAWNCLVAYDAAYNQVNNTKKKNKDRSAAIFGYNMNEFEKCSNRAVAVHIKNKLFLMGLKLKSSDEIEDEEKDNLISPEAAARIINNYIRDEKKLLNLQKFEHERWNLFHFSEGWKSPTLDDIAIYRKILGEDSEKKHKYILARLHGCLCSWKDLNIFEKEYGDVKKYDEIFIRDIPSILGIDFVKSNSLNIGEVEFSFLNI